MNLGCTDHKDTYRLVGNLNGLYNSISTNTNIIMCSDTIGTISGFVIEDTTIYVQMDIKSVYKIPQSASLNFSSLTLFTDPVLWIDTCIYSSEFYMEKDTIKINIIVN